MVKIESMLYASTECIVGFGYDPANDHNLYRVSRDAHIEYLDVTEPESVEAVHQAVRRVYLRLYHLQTYFFIVGHSERKTV